MTDTTRREVCGSQASQISEDAGTREQSSSDPALDAVPLLKEMRETAKWFDEAASELARTWPGEANANARMAGVMRGLADRWEALVRQKDDSILKLEERLRKYGYSGL